MDESLLVTGFPYDFLTRYNELMMRFEKCLKGAQGIRRLGSAALDLCFVACGQFEGFWEQQLNPWDTAAGTLIVKEAGGLVTDFSGTSYDPMVHNEILATNHHIHSELQALLAIEDCQ